MSIQNLQASLPLPSQSSFPSIQISDSLTKFSLYLQKMTSLELQSSQQQKCQKVLRLSFQTFLKYSESEQFSKKAYDTVKSLVLQKKSYHALYLLDLMLKNNKYVIKAARKEVDSMMRTVWEKTWTEYQNEEKIENLKIMIKCWGYIYGQKIEESLRKWLEHHYAIKKIQLNEQNEKLLKEVYQEKIQSNNQNQKETKISQALLNSLVDDDNNGFFQPYFQNTTIQSTGQGSGPGKKNLIFGSSRQGYSQLQMSQKPKSSTISNLQKQSSAKIPDSKKSLLQALELD